MYFSDPVLECQNCGNVVRHLSPAEAQQVANNPYDYIVFCTSCKKYEEVDIGLRF